MKILVAEEDPLMSKMLEYRLKMDRHEVMVSRDGSEALKKIEKVRPDLVITDIMVPFTSGLELIRAVKARYITIPIIVLSGMDQASIIIEAFRLGADDYMSKPFNLDELSLRVKRFMSRTPAGPAC
jgi:DNA-binding response OmpR family regulator